MTVLTAIVAALIVSAALWGLWYVARAVLVWRRFRGDRVVTCPETGHPAAVRIDLQHAIEAGRTCGPDLRLSTCSRWPERGPCDQPCVPEAAARQSAVDAIARRWYAHTRCTYCGKPIDDPRWLDHHAALQDSDGITHEWSDVRPEQLVDALRAGTPVCWSCHVTETFRHSYPNLVTDRTNARRAH
jgi:hypothetical protein